MGGFLLRCAESIADAPDRHDIPRPHWMGFELRAQPVDVGIHGVLKSVVGGPPHLIEQVRPHQPAAREARTPSNAASVYRDGLGRRQSILRNGAGSRPLMRALHVRLTFAFALLLESLAVGLLPLLRRTSDRYSDEVLQRLDTGIASYVVQELPLLEVGKVNEAALHELAHRTMTVNPSAEVYLLDPLGRRLSTAIPRNRILRVSVRLDPIRTFLQYPDRRPLYGDD